MHLHQAGALIEAEGAYRHVLATNPSNPQALYLCGVVTGQLGRPQEAIDLLQRAVLLQPDHLPAISELARQFQETGQLQASAEALRGLISSRPDLGELHSNIGTVLLRLGRLEEAAVACAKAVELSPDSAEAHSNLGDALKGLQRFEEAAAAYRRTMVLKPGMKDVLRNLAAVLRNSGRLDEAAEVLKQWLRQDPHDPIAQHMVPAYCGGDTPARASDDYVRRVFDEFAESFDDDLRGLDYRGPRLIAEAMTAELGQAAGLDVLDAGCGTGLCGPLLRPVARRLVGVDLSGAMIQHARRLNLYDDLVEGELTGYLSAHPQDFDLIVAADTFNYFGALEPLLTAAARALREGGILIYTLEQGDASARAADYRLNPHGRYSHNQDYVERCMSESGLRISSMESATLRKEREEPVTGMVVRARSERQVGF